MFERMLSLGRDVRTGIPPALLKVQYRMHPLISHFPNVSFYGGRLQDGVPHTSR
jgi:superfamily I DNA and/or RNA helicase